MITVRIDTVTHVVEKKYQIITEDSFIDNIASDLLILKDSLQTPTGVDIHPDSIYLTQSDISVALGVTRSAVSNWLMGTRRTRKPFPDPVLPKTWLRCDVIGWHGKQPISRSPELDKAIHIINIAIKLSIASNVDLKNVLEVATVIYNPGK